MPVVPVGAFGVVAPGPTLPELEAPDAFCAKAAPDSATTQAEAISIFLIEAVSLMLRKENRSQREMFLRTKASVRPLAGTVPVAGTRELERRSMPAVDV
jgi:hypothetical protein